MSNEPVKKKPKVKSEGLWLMSFADLSFVLMCFFALLLSFSSMDKQRFENVRDGIVAKSNVEIKDKPTVKKKKNNLKTISKELIEEIKKQNLDAEVKYDAEGVAVEIRDKLFFRSGSARIQKQYQHLTKKLLKIIAKSPDRYKLEFEGHTDDIRPGKKAIYKSNWELSSHRGVAMLKEMRKMGVAEGRMSVVSYAHTKPKKPIKGLKGQALRDARAANRRVVIWIK